MILESVFLDEEGINRALTRITHEIREKNNNIEKVVFIGINQKGYVLAKRISNITKSFNNTEILVGMLDIKFYNGNLLKIKPNIGFDVNNKVVVLIDDVFLSGRTASAAISMIFYYWCPSNIQIGVLIDGGHREYPILPNFVGKNIPTSKRLKISVELQEIDEISCVKLLEDINS